MFKDHAHTLNRPDRAPVFGLGTAAGGAISNEDLRGNKLLLFFLRGTRVPNSGKQRNLLESAWDEFDRRGTGVVRTRSQTIDGIVGGKNLMMEDYERFPVRFDRISKITKADGVYHRNGIDSDRADHPGVLRLDQEQTIRRIAVRPNKVERPTNRTLVEVIEAAGRY